MLEKILALFLIFAAAACIWIASDPYDVGGFSFGGKNTFSETVSEDLHHMLKKGLLPKAWDSIQYVTYNFNSELQRELVGNQKFKIKDGPPAATIWRSNSLTFPTKQIPPSFCK